MIQQGELFEFEARNLQPKFNRRKIGDVYHVDIEIDEALWERLKLLPASATLSGRLYWHDDAPQSVIERAERQFKSEHSEFWQQMCKRGLLNALDLRQVLGCDDADTTGTKKALYGQFGVDSLADIHPSDFARWCTQRNLNSIVMMAAQVVDHLNAS